MWNIVQNLDKLNLKDATASTSAHLASAAPFPSEWAAAPHSSSWGPNHQLPLGVLAYPISATQQMGWPCKIHLTPTISIAHPGYPYSTAGMRQQQHQRLSVLLLAPPTHPQRRCQGDASKLYNTNPSNNGVHELLCLRLFSEYCFWVYKTRHREWQQVNLNRCD